MTSHSTETAAALEAIERHPGLLAYLRHGFAGVEGWCEPRTLEVLAELSELQDDAGTSGGSAEIGVYHGKLLIALHLLRTPGTRTLAVDLFEHQELNLDRSGSGDSSHVRRNLEANCPDPDDVEMMARDSLDLGDDDVLAIVQRHGRFRWFSVDGGHTVDHAVNDLRLAERLTTAGGIVVVDDYYNQDWPGVHEGFARRYILDSPRTVPFLVGFAKVYLTTLGHHKRYFRAIGERLQTAGYRVKVVRMYGHQVVSVGEAPTEPRASS
ncbi:MAG: class I SAM-dependent methyltransferase [Chloroflexota bacterium]|nr:class I SAM-dependent methyltransferase [Chloroflexota bacterium]